jgi:glycosyltransferase involved in cell wall biosynthesis
MDSVEWQTLEAWEHIIVDDGSGDGTAEEVRRRSDTNPRFRYIQRTGYKPGANVFRNLGMRESRSKLIVFLDSDDMLRPNCLEMRVQIMNRNADLDFAVFRGGVFIRSVGDLPRLYHDQNPGDDLLRFLNLDCVWQTTGPVWRRSFLETIGAFDENPLSMQDLELHVRAICAGGKYICFREIDHDIRGHSDPARTSTRHFADAAYIESAERVTSSLFSTVKNAGLLTWSRQRALQGLGFGLAECWLRVGHTDRAIMTWNKCCSQHGAPLHLRLLGLGMLRLLHFSRSDTDLISRAANKWKGWIRFRQEPNLLKVGVP